MMNNRERIGRSLRPVGVSLAILAATVAWCWVPVAASAAPSGAAGTADTTVSPDSLPVYDLGDIITVRGQYTAPVSSISTVSSATMKERGTTSIAAALSGTPGVVVTAGSKGESRLQVRGFLAQETMVLYDGRPVALPYYGDLDLSVLPLSNVSKVSVFKGPSPILYGANSMGGVVNIVSQRVTGRPVREVRLSASQNNGYDMLLNYGAAFKRFDWWLSAGRGSSDGYDLSDDFAPVKLEDGMRRHNSDYRHFNLDGKLNYTLRNGIVVSLSTGIYDAERSLPSGTDRGQFQRYPLWRRWYTDLGADGWLGTSVYWKSKLYYDDCENRLQRYSDSAMSDENLVFDSYHDSYALGGILTTTARINDQTHNAMSVNYRRDVIKRQDDLGEPWEGNSMNLLTVSDQFERILAPGLRAEMGTGYSVMTSTPEETSTDALDLYGGVTYAPRTWLDLHLSVSRATRFPTLNQLYASKSGNPDLKPQRALKTEIGYRARINDRLTLDQAYFLSDVTDLIDRKHKDSLYENIEEVDLSGLETGLGYEDRRWAANINYTYLHAREFNVEGATTTEAWRSHSPRHKIDYSLRWKSAFGLGIGHSGQAIMSRVGPDKKEMKNYFLAHAKITYKIITGLEMFVNVRNLFDTNYEEEKYYPMAGRQVSVGVEVSL